MTDRERRRRGADRKREVRAIGTISPSSEKASNPECWDGHTLIVNRAKRLVLRAGCSRVRCESCVGVHLSRIKRATARACVEQLVTVTKVGNDWQTVRARMARVKYRAQKLTGEPLDWAWVVEVNPRRTGHHVHAVKRGRFLDHAKLTAACAREGVGFCWLSPAADRADADEYLMKYAAKSARLSWHEYLRVNGGRLVHTSRGFWLDDGGRATTWRRARAGHGDWECVVVADPASFELDELPERAPPPRGPRALYTGTARIVDS